MLAGLERDGGSMFNHLMLGMEPNAEDMEKQAQAVLYNKTVKISEVRVETYDLGVKEQAKEYAKIMGVLYTGMQLRTHIILFSDRHFVEKGGKPRWIAHVEWAVFELKVEANKPISSAKEESKDDKDSRSNPK